MLFSLSTMSMVIGIGISISTATNESELRRLVPLQGGRMVVQNQNAFHNHRLGSRLRLGLNGNQGAVKRPMHESNEFGD